MPVGLSKAEQVELAQNLATQDVAKDDELPTDTEDAFQFVLAATVEEVDAHRERWLGIFEQAFIDTAARNEELQGLVPSEISVRVRNLNLGMIEWFIKLLSFTSYPLEDDNLLADCMSGFPQVGDLPTSGAYCKPCEKFGDKISRECLDEWRSEANWEAINCLHESDFSKDLMDSPRRCASWFNVRTSCHWYKGRR